MCSCIKSGFPRNLLQIKSFLQIRSRAFLTRIRNFCFRVNPFRSPVLSMKKSHLKLNFILAASSRKIRLTRTKFNTFFQRACSHVPIFASPQPHFHLYDFPALEICIQHTLHFPAFYFSAVETDSCTANSLHLIRSLFLVTFHIPGNLRLPNINYNRKFPAAF